MVCPYCSTDMEPIELNGKVFCSNCGLTIKTLAEPTRISPNASVVSGYKNPSFNEPVKDVFPAFPAENNTPVAPNNMNPITDSAKEELGIEVNHPENDLETLDTPQLNTEEIHDIPQTADALLEQNTIAQEVNNTSESIEDEIKTDDIDSIVKTLSQTELSTHKPLPNGTNSDQIKEIESLAAGGILLDILSDDLIHNEDEAEVKVLDAAKKLVKHIKPADISEINSTQTEKPDTGSENSDPSTHKVKETEAEKTETEAEIKEIEEKIHNLKEKSFEVSDKEIKKYDPDALDMAHLKIEHKTSRIVSNNNNDIKATLKAAILPSSENLNSQDNNNDNASNKADVDYTLDTERNNVTEINNLEVEPIITPETTAEMKPETSDKPVAELPAAANLKQKKKKIFQLKNLFLSNKPKGDKLTKKISQKSLHNDANIKVERKSSHVSPEYFKKIIEINKAQKQVSKTDKHKLYKNKKTTKGKKFLFLYIILGIIGIFVLITAIFVINNSTKPEAQIERAISSTTFNTKKPNYVPEGYILSGADFDKTKNIYKLEYTFATDKNRKVILTQTKQTEPTDYIENLIRLEHKDKEYTQKTVNEQDYTEVAKYTIVWNRAEMVYTISATNTIMDNNLLYKMAESIE